ncbi:MAG: DUF3795 domain-containing protein [Syntrophaceae bacterium]|nr:DUF3795 domain-containing protein [Syntrophaceae bacterium]
MSRTEIKDAIAPCGLCCETCFAHVDGKIRRLALELKEKLGNFEPYAMKFETLLGNPIFSRYTSFKEMLDYFASENCRGCRKENCRLFKECGVSKCFEDQEVDFCHECSLFPCDKTNFDPVLHKTWLAVNQKIRKVGIEDYYEHVRTACRYP